MKSLSGRTGLSNLPAELIHEISIYVSAAFLGLGRRI